MKSESQFPKLPSLNELLQHPAVEKVVDRLNQTTIAQRATGFLSELQSSLLERAGQVVPSLNLIAERFAYRLLEKSAHGLPVVNATGEVCTDSWKMPLADAALQEILRTAGEFHANHQSVIQQTLDTLTDLTGAEAGLLLNSYEAATKLVQECEIQNVDFAEFAGLMDPKEFGLLTVPSIADRVKGDVNLVVCNGSGLIGGPSCGIVLGTQDAIAKLQENPWSSLASADLLTTVALAATLEIYQSSQQVIHQIPVWQILSAPIENLQQRAERLSLLISASEFIASAEPQAAESVWYHSNLMQLSGPTWLIKIHGETQSAESLINLLGDNLPSIIAKIEADSVLLDLRTVFPRWDQSLVEVFQTTQSESQS